MRTLSWRTSKEMLKETVEFIPYRTATVNEQAMETIARNPNLLLALLDTYNLLGEKVPLLVTEKRCFIPIALAELNNNLLYIFEPVELLELEHGYYKRSYLTPYIATLVETPRGDIELLNIAIISRWTGETLPQINAIRSILILPTFYELIRNGKDRAEEIIRRSLCALLIPPSSWNELTVISDLSQLENTLNNIVKLLPIRSIHILDRPERWLTTRINTCENSNLETHTNLAAVDISVIPIIAPADRNFFIFPSSRSGEPVIVPEHLKDKVLLDIYLTPRTFIEMLAEFYRILGISIPSTLLKLLKEILEQYETPVTTWGLIYLLDLTSTRAIDEIASKHPDILLLPAAERLNRVRKMVVMLDDVEKFLRFFTITAPEIVKVEKYSIPMSRYVTCLSFKGDRKGEIYLR
ncbi:MAG: hypothetical protein GXO26_02825 [Crenarchaeota archaeon]|nr:hypothetical protein [Thermoproteota archaeon]